MAVIVGSARIDENGRATGGLAGDQTGKELSTQNWYSHTKGWNVFRIIDKDKRKRCADAMRAACANSSIGYDQNQRLTLYNAAKAVAFDVARVSVKCETDCSALVRVCLAYAGITVGNFRTTTQKTLLMATGQIIQLEGAKYEKSSDYLLEGDILCTKTQGHTVVVLSDGKLAESDNSVNAREYSLGDRILRNGCVGEDVRELQTLLISVGCELGMYGADGEFGDMTELAVRAFQMWNGCAIDGEVGPETLKAIDRRRITDNEGVSDKPRYVKGMTGDSYVREFPNKQANKLGVLDAGGMLEYLNETSADGWYAVRFENCRGWVSGMYTRLE